jgi:hypothetical protein
VKLLEKELENIIFDGIGQHLGQMMGRGFYCPIIEPTWVKQQSLGDYGIPDLLCFGTSTVTGHPHVIVYELKRDFIGARNITQLSKYMAGVRHWLTASGVFNEGDEGIANCITGVLVGTRIDETCAGFLGSRIKMLTARYSPFGGISFNDFSDSIGFGEAMAPDLPYNSDDLFSCGIQLGDLSKDSFGQKYRGPVNRWLHSATQEKLEDLKIVSNLVTATESDELTIPYWTPELNLSFNRHKQHGFVIQNEFSLVLNLTKSGIYTLFKNIPAKRICKAADRCGALIASRNNSFQRQIRIGHDRPWFYSFDLYEAQAFISSSDTDQAGENFDMFSGNRFHQTERYSTGAS